MKTELHDGETIEKESKANMQKGLENVAGHLYLTTERLIFEPHKFNIQTGVTLIDREAINKISKSWTRFLYFFPVSPNSITIEDNSGNEYRFVIRNRESWISSINNFQIK